VTDNTAATSRRTVAALTALAAAAILAALVAAVFLLSGSRLFIVTTPSMATAAPVGTLVDAQPQSAYHVGDVITYTVDGRVVTHRIHAETGGVITTKGDLNGSPDGWQLTASDVVGKAVALIPGAGWILRALPWLLAGICLTEVVILAGRARRDWAWNLRLIGWSASIALVSYVLRPWVGVQLLDFRADDARTGVLMHLVNTGLYPFRAEGTVLHAGQDAVVLTTQRLASGAYYVTPTAELSLGMRLAILLACLVPLFIALMRRHQPALFADAARPAAIATVRRGMRGGVVALSVIVTILLVVAITVSGTGAAFAARLSNTGSVGSNAAFSCADAVNLPTAGAPAGSLVAGFAMNTVSGNSRNETNLIDGGNGPKGKWATPTVTAATAGCARDRPAASVTFDGQSQCLFPPDKSTTPTTFSIEAWFRTATKGNGRIIGFDDAGGSVGGPATKADRMVYLDPAGRVVFGVAPGGTATTVATAASFADDTWHHVVATLSSAGMALYVDGALAASKPATTSARAQNGYWKIGCGTLTGWPDGAGAAYPNAPSYFTGQLEFAAIYSTALTAADVRTHYLAGR
jgi:signal peptidase I